MTPSFACQTLVTSFEGCVLKAYPDPASGSDPWTVGIGHTGPDVHPSTVWTKDQAVSALVKDLTRTGVGVTSLIDGHPTSQSQFDALVSFAFNLGLGALGRSTLLKLHKAGDYAGAQKQFRYWNKAAGKVMTGLTRRRAAEADLYGARP